VPFIAVCPYCRFGRIRAPEQALGLTAPCPRCHASFTLVDSGESLNAAPPVAPVRSTHKAPVDPAATAIINRPVVAASDAPTAVYDATAEMDVPSPGIHIIDDPSEENEPLRAPTLLTFILAGLALVASQIPYGRFGTVGLAVIGVLIGAACWIGSRRPLIPATGTILNVLVILIVTLLPTWLGIKSWHKDPVDLEKKTVQTFGHDGLKPASGDWVDVSQSWQFDDVRVRAVVTTGPVELTGPKGQKKWTKNQYLQVRVAVANVGVSRAFDVTGWDDKIPARMVDAAGNPVAEPKFETGWEPTLRRKHASLTPGQSVEHDLLFEAPATPGVYFRLELSGVGCGAPEQFVRFQIPTRPLGYR
jgi:hypothetical protein